MQRGPRVENLLQLAAHHSEWTLHREKVGVGCTVLFFLGSQKRFGSGLAAHHRILYTHTINLCLLSWAKTEAKPEYNIYSVSQHKTLSSVIVQLHTVHAQRHLEQLSFLFYFCNVTIIDRAFNMKQMHHKLSIGITIAPAHAYILI